MRIAFCKYAGLAAGGTEKYLQSLALLYKKAGHDIDYYYTDATPIEGTDWKHPDTCQVRKAIMEDSGIFLQHIKAEFRSSNKAEWVGTDFFDRFDPKVYDYLVTAGDGREEFPYHLIKDLPIIHTIHGWHVYNAPNIHKSVLLSNWQAGLWANNGGDKSKLEVIPSLIPIPNFESGFRKEHGIPEDAIVFGLHQAPGNASVISVEAFNKIARDDTYYVILGGDQLHRHHASKNVICLSLERDATKVHSFLDAIDVYAHCRRDGEVCSAALIEAMAHGKPIVSHRGDGTNLGHLEQVEGVGKVTESLGEYVDELAKFLNLEYREEYSRKATQKYESTYSHDVVADRFLGLLNAA